MKIKGKHAKEKTEKRTVRLIERDLSGVSGGQKKVTKKKATRISLSDYSLE